MKITLLLIAITVIAYFLGGLNGAIITSRYVYRRDVRTLGSGNAGLTNFYRVFGAKGLATVAAIDILKGVISALIGGLLLGFTGEGNADVGRCFAAFCVVLGHCFPLYYGFKGGKGVLCGISAAMVADWRAGMICILIFGVIVVFTRWVSLASLVGALSCPVAMLGLGHSTLSFELILFAAALIVLRHAENIVRLIRGTESKFEFRRDVTYKLDEDEF